jgi:hypothetical protein
MISITEPVLPSSLNAAFGIEILLEDVGAFSR